MAILGLPLFIWFGILSIISMFSAVICILLSKKGFPKLYKWHPRLGVITVIFAIIHVILVILNY